MEIVVRVKDIVDALEMGLDEVTTYLDTETGEVETVTHEVSRLVDEDDDGEGLPQWQKPELELAKTILKSAPGRFRILPSKFDVHEWSIMEQFAYACERDSHRNAILDAIHGAGAFRHFKSTIRRLG